MTEPIEFVAVFAQGCDAIKPKKEGHARLWLDAWVSKVDRAKLELFWEQDVRFRIRIEPDPQ